MGHVDVTWRVGAGGWEAGERKEVAVTLNSGESDEMEVVLRGWRGRRGGNERAAAG